MTGGRGAAVHVTLHLWRVPRRRVSRVFWRMAIDRGPLRGIPGVRFAKLVGTSRNRRFGPMWSDATRWATLVVWDDATTALRFDATATAGAWRALASSSCRLDLRPLASRGAWGGGNPFTPTGSGAGDGPVLALTRARLRPARAATFWRAIGPVAEAASTAPGLLAAFGIGEAPIGWQGTVSLWRHARDLVEFAYGHPDHRQAIERTPPERWYAEDLFARFAVLGVTGDVNLIGLAEEGTLTAVEHRAAPTNPPVRTDRE